MSNYADIISSNTKEKPYKNYIEREKCYNCLKSGKKLHF